MKRTKISLDVDGIISDFVTAAYKILGKPIPQLTEFYSPDLTEIVKQVKGDENFWRTLPMMIKPSEIKFNVDAYITAIPEAMTSARETWLRTNQYPPAPMYVSHDKHLVINELGIGIHVDDKLQTIIDIQTHCPNCVPILHLPWYLDYPGRIPEGTLVTRSTKELNDVVMYIQSRDIIQR